MATPRRTFVRGGRPRRQTFWLGGTFVNTTLASANSAAVITSLSAAALLLRPFTIIRMRGIIQVRSDQTAANEDYSGIVGHCVVTDQAVAVGITAVPTPVAESDSDLWFQYDPFAGDYESLTSVGTNEKGRQYIVDSKAMRRVDQGFDFVQVGENSAASNGTILTTFFRTLIKLH